MNNYPTNLRAILRQEKRTLTPQETARAQKFQAVGRTLLRVIEAHDPHLTTSMVDPGSLTEFRTYKDKLTSGTAVRLTEVGQFALFGAEYLTHLHGRANKPYGNVRFTELRIGQLAADEKPTLEHTAVLSREDYVHDDTKYGEVQLDILSRLSSLALKPLRTIEAPTISDEVDDMFIAYDQLAAHTSTTAVA